MPKEARAANARAAAQSYAPHPNGSTITYGLIAVALVLVAAIFAGAFYRVDVFYSLWPIGLIMLLAFIGGAALRAYRREAHERAFSAEYHDPSRIAAAAAPDLPSTGLMVSPTVTFRSPFMLPGIDRPHPAGTFEVRERRESIDVSFDAAIVTRTIMLTGGGVIQALDVKSDDLAAALDLDARQAG